MKVHLRSILVGSVALTLAVAAAYFALSVQLIPRIGLLIVATLLALIAVAVILGARVAMGVLAAALTGLAFAGSLWLATSKSGVVSIVAGIAAYVAWLVFSGALFGTPVIVLPFPPFFIFAWQKLEGQRKREAVLRFGTIAFFAVAVSVLLDVHRRAPGEEPEVSKAQQRAVDGLAGVMERSVRSSLQKSGPAIGDMVVRVDSARVVTIGGFVQDSVSRSRAEGLVREMPGVTNVTNELRIR